MPNPRWTHDRKLSKGRHGIVGVDEAGRGCLAGPVVAGCVLLPAPFFGFAKNRKKVEQVNDSKQFSETQREVLYESILQLAQEGEIMAASGSASIEEIEQHNIVGATCLAMRRAMEKVSHISEGFWQPEAKGDGDLFGEMNSQGGAGWEVLVDGREMKRLPYAHTGLVKGDTMSLAISMASLVAKVTRDRLMRELDAQYPQYDFCSNKGYGAPLHLKVLKEIGPTMHHRPRFLRNLLGQDAPKEKRSEEQCQLSFG